MPNSGFWQIPLARKSRLLTTLWALLFQCVTLWYYQCPWIVPTANELSITGTARSGLHDGRCPDIWQRSRWVWCTPKEILTNTPFLALYDLGADIKVSADAFPFGLGAVILQRSEGIPEWWAVSFASCRKCLSWARIFSKGWNSLPHLSVWGPHKFAPTPRILGPPPCRHIMEKRHELGKWHPMIPSYQVHLALCCIMVVALSWLRGEQMARHPLQVTLHTPPQMCQDHGKAKGVVSGYP